MVSDISKQQLVLDMVQSLAPLILVHAVALADPYCLPDDSASLRERSHNKTLLNRSTDLNNYDFLIRML